MRTDEALIVVDVQNDFLEMGALAVPNGSEVIEPINKLIDRFENVTFTQDWHPSDHTSFAENHPGKKIYDLVDLPYGRQILWPTHCVQETFGSEIAGGLNVKKGTIFIKKGTNKDIDSYSAFLEADRATKTQLEDKLREIGVKKLYICGLATDFCVSWTAMDAADCGFDVTVVIDACRGINIDDSVAKAKKAWEEKNIKVSTVLDLLND